PVPPPLEQDASETVIGTATAAAKAPRRNVRRSSPLCSVVMVRVLPFRVSRMCRWCVRFDRRRPSRGAAYAVSIEVLQCPVVLVSARDVGRDVDGRGRAEL